MTISLFWELAINCVSDMNYNLLTKEVIVDTFFPTFNPIVPCVHMCGHKNLQKKWHIL